MNCDVCGNQYEACFAVWMAGEKHVFDCFECAIHALAPTCAQCGCKVVGHGVSRADEIFCCQHCLRMVMAGERDAEDRRDQFDEDAYALDADADGDLDADADDDLDADADDDEDYEQHDDADFEEDVEDVDYGVFMPVPRR
jgi:hypothetical protein